MTNPSVHALSIDHTIEGMESHLHLGLSSQEARARLEQHGPNELTERPRPGFLKLLLAQFNNFLVIILIVAAVVSLLLGEVVDAIAIMAIVVLNAVARRGAGVEGRTGAGCPEEDGRAQRPGRP